MRFMDAFEHARRVREKDWRGFSFPEPVDIPRPWHRVDKDSAFRRIPDNKHPNSDAIIAHLKANSTGFRFGAAGTTPDYTGKTGGVFLNTARLEDPQYTISKKNGLRNLCVTTGYSAPYGKKVRIGSHMVPQGFPMNEYSDHKLHVWDPIDRTITEVQFITNTQRNPFLMWLINLFSWLTGERGGGYQCHGVKQYRIDAPSTDPSVVGSSVAGVPLAETNLSYLDLTEGTIHMTTCAVPPGAQSKTAYVWPARNTDGTSNHADAMRPGYILKLKTAKYLELTADPETKLQSRNLLRAWHEHGIMDVDSGGHVSTGCDPDPRYEHEELNNTGAKVTLDDFEIYTLSPVTLVTDP